MSDQPAKHACSACQGGTPLGFDFSMAFQPIVDARDRSVYAYEALVRGTDGSGAASILGASLTRTAMPSTRLAG